MKNKIVTNKNNAKEFKTAPAIIKVKKLNTNKNTNKNGQ